MAQDPRKALDDKTRQLVGSKVETGKEHPAYQASQQQLLAIQAERQQNLAVAREQARANLMNTQTLAQAAELGAVSAAEAEQAAMMGGGGVQLNPATQAVLGKYGVGQPKFVRTHFQNQQVTRQNITINNNTNVNTTNDVKVPANIGGPVQGRPLQFKQGAGDSTGKFKAWISSAFQRQNEEGARRDREFRNRESSLSRSASRMMKKLEDIGNTIGTRMDPRKIGSTWQSQLRALMLIFGFGYLAKNWTKILDTVGRIESKIRDWLGFFGVGVKGDSKFSVRVRDFFGLKKGENFSESLKKIFGDIWDSIKIEAKYFFKERADAIKQLEFPQITGEDIEEPVKAIKKFLPYLGNLFTVALGGMSSLSSAKTDEIINTSKNKLSKESQKYTSLLSGYGKKYEGYYDGNKGVNLSGDNAILASPGDINYRGSKNELGLTTYSMTKLGDFNTEHMYAAGVGHSSSIMKKVKDAKDSGLIYSSDIATLFENLYHGSKNSKEKRTPVSDGLVNEFLTPEEISSFQSQKKLVRRKYVWILKEKTLEDLLLEDASPEAEAVYEGLNTAIRGEISPTFNIYAHGGQVASGTVLGASIGTLFAPGLGTLIGGVAGLAGSIYLANDPKAQALIAGYKKSIESRKVPRYRQELVPLDDVKKNKNKYIYKLDGDKFDCVRVWEASPEVIQQMVRNASKLANDVELEGGNYHTSEVLSGIEKNYNTITNADEEARLIMDKLSSANHFAGKDYNIVMGYNKATEQFGVLTKEGYDKHPEWLGINTPKNMYVNNNSSGVAMDHIKKDIKAQNYLYNMLYGAGVTKMTREDFLKKLKDKNGGEIIEYVNNLINNRYNKLKSYTTDSSIIEDSKKQSSKYLEELNEEKEKEYNSEGGNWVNNYFSSGTTVEGGEGSDHTGGFESPEAFTKTLYNEYINQGIKPEVAIAMVSQDALESTWGTSPIAKAATNYGGMKWFEQYHKGTPYHTNSNGDKFRKFNNVGEYVKAKISFTNSDNYYNASTTSNTAEEYLKRIQHKKDGGAYAEKDIGYENIILDTIPTTQKYLGGTSVSSSTSASVSSSTSSTDSSFSSESFLSRFIGKLRDLVMGAWDTTKSVAGNIKNGVSNWSTALSFSRNKSRYDIESSGMHYGNVSEAYVNYNDYLKNSDDLPEGMNYLQWKSYVYQKAGAFPMDLRSRLDKNVKFNKTKTDAEIESSEESATQLEGADVPIVKSGYTGIFSEWATGKLNEKVDTAKDTHTIADELLPKIIELLDKSGVYQKLGLVQSEKNSNTNVKALTGVANTTATSISKLQANGLQPPATQELYREEDDSILDLE